MKTVEQLETELRDALARERQLREALEFISTQLQSDSDDGIDAHTIARKVTQALTTPAPRVFTLADVRPLVEALNEASKWCGSTVKDALDHARKLGMEGA